MFTPETAAANRLPTLFRLNHEHPVGIVWLLFDSLIERT
jgi:hypothetical protein